jgi:hypothetical protein
VEKIQGVGGRRPRVRLNLVIFSSRAEFAHDFKSLAGEPRGIEPETNRGALDPPVGCTVDRAGQVNFSGRGIGPELRTPATLCCCRPLPPLKLFFIMFGSLGFCWASPSAASGARAAGGTRAALNIDEVDRGAVSDLLMDRASPHAETDREARCAWPWIS